MVQAEVNDSVVDLSARVAALEADLAAADKRWDRSSDRWCVLTPEQGAEWFDSRADAEAFAVDLMTDALRDSGEAGDEQCTILAVVSTTEEVVGAEVGDGSDAAEWLKERGLDYEVTGYTCTPGTRSHFIGDFEHPAATAMRLRMEAERAALEAEREKLRAVVLAVAASLAAADAEAGDIYADGRIFRNLSLTLDEVLGLPAVVTTFEQTAAALRALAGGAS